MPSRKFIILGWLCVVLSLMAPLAITVHSTTSAEAVFEYVAVRKTAAQFTDEQMKIILAGVSHAHASFSEPRWLLEIVTLVYAVGLFFIGVVLVTSDRKRGPIQPPQRNAGSRPSSDDSSASETPSSLGPRG